MYNKEQLLNAIWNNPGACTGLHFERKGERWHSRQRLDGTDGNKPIKTTLKWGKDDRGNNTIWVNYNGGSFPAGQTIWNYLHWLYSTNEHIEVLERVARTYGVEADLTQYNEQQRQRAKKRAEDKEVMKVIAKYITNALQGQDGTEATAYLNGRKLEATARMGAYNTNVRKGLIEHLQKTFSNIAYKDIEAFLRACFPTIRKDYTRNSNGEWVDKLDCYQLAAPYYNGSSVTGFWLRQTKPATITNADGTTQELPKYLFSKDMPKGGYCGSIRSNEAVILVEGMLDAEAMKQAGFNNVMALGGQTISDNQEDAEKSQIATLKRYGVKHLIYVPDYEYNKDGTLRTDATQRTIAAIRPHITNSLHAQGFNSVSIANLETAEARQNKTKVDAADYIAMFGNGSMRGVLSNAVTWYEYQLKATLTEYAGNPTDIAAACYDIYDSIPNPIDKERLKRSITEATGGYKAELKSMGVTAAALSVIDKCGIQSTAEELRKAARKAIAEADTAEAFAKALKAANRIQGRETHANFAAQVNITQAQMHEAVKNKPEPLQTTWDMYAYNRKTKIYYPNRKISFTPAAISILAAPTNHGKTLVLLQTAINIVKQTGKKVLYLSFENDAEQLYIRALAAYIGKDWKNATYLNESNGVKYPIGNPRGVLREHIKAADMPKQLFLERGNSLNIDTYIKRYWGEIAPNLALVRMQADVDAVYNSITQQVEEWRNCGVEVGGIFIDYLQLLHAENGGKTRTEEVKAVCDKLNDMAKATGLPVICACQFNRSSTAAQGDKLDGIELANIGESAGIENIAEDVYLVYQVDKIKETDYMKNGNFEIPKYKYRSRRCFKDITDKDTLLSDYLYIENLKARDYATGGHCLLPYMGEAGCITSDNSEYSTNSEL